MHLNKQLFNSNCHFGDSTFNSTFHSNIWLFNWNILYEHSMQTFNSYIRFENSTINSNIRLVNLKIQHQHSIRTFDSNIQFEHSIWTFNSNIQFEHSIQTFNSNIQFKHSFGTFNSNFQCKHNPHMVPRVIRPTSGKFANQKAGKRSQIQRLYVWLTKFFSVFSDFQRFFKTRDHLSLFIICIVSVLS